MSQRQAARDADRPAYPAIRERIGEDPARFLCAKMDPWPRIRGLDTIGDANAWLQVARDIDHQRGLELIERQRDHLLEAQQQ